jgi:hypothetical protein
MSGLVANLLQPKNKRIGFLCRSRIATCSVGVTFLSFLCSQRNACLFAPQSVLGTIQKKCSSLVAGHGAKDNFDSKMTIALIRGVFIIFSNFTLISSEASF